MINNARLLPLWGRAAQCIAVCIALQQIMTSRHHPFHQAGFWPYRYFIFLSWLPSYFHRSQGLNLQASSLSAFIPWATLALCSSAAGFVADRLLARGMAVATVRKRLQSIAFLVPAAMLLLLARPGVSARAAVSFMTLALGATSLSEPRVQHTCALPVPCKAAASAQVPLTIA